MAHSAFPHAHPHAPQTEGMVIHWATRYDLLVSALTLGGMRRLYNRVADVVEAKPGDKIVDVGCGPGKLALVLAQRVGPGGLVAGIDASPEMIARARQNAQRRHAAIDFRVEPVEALTFPDQQFDSVVSSFVYHHLPGDDLKRQALTSIARVLKPGGRLCIVDFMPPDDPHQRAPMATDSQALTDLLRETGFEAATVHHDLPSLGWLTRVYRVPPAGYVLARRAAN
jgi:ubiquinone/menaquinone biosynthesis C-methylase UbiE